MHEPTQAAQLRELLRTLIRKLGILERSELVCCDITLSQCNALIEIGRAGVLSVNQLADRLGLDKSTVSRAADKLVLDGLLLREEDPSDRRYVVLKLSPAGANTYAAVEQRMQDYFLAVLARIETDDREAVLTNLQVLLTALQGGPCC